MSSAAPTGPQTPALEGGPVSAVVILAAGEGKRMRSSRSKLLHEIAGHSMLSYAVDAATALEPEHVVVVVGHLREQVEAHLDEIAPTSRPWSRPSSAAPATRCRWRWPRCRSCTATSS